MSEVDTPKYDMRRLHLHYQMDHNPLINPRDSVHIEKKKKFQTVGETREMVDTKTGEIVEQSSQIVTVKEVDDAHFVKIFREGIAAAYELSRTGQRVFGLILERYEQEPLTGGFADTIKLAWFDNGLFGEDIGMSQQTYNRGMRELLEKKFIAPKMPNEFWVNPALFFKGDRVAFIKEYRRKTTGDERSLSEQATPS